MKNLNAVPRHPHAKKFAALYEKYAELLLFYAKRDVRNQEDAEDVVAETFIKVSGHLDQLSDDLNDRRTYNYIVTIMKNTIRDLYRKRIRRPESLQEDNGADKTFSTSLHEVDDEVLLRVEARELMDRLDAMDDIYQIPFRLKFIHDFTDQEIADFMGISRMAAATRAHRAKEKLKRALEEWNQDEEANRNE